MWPESARIQPVVAVARNLDGVCGTYEPPVVDRPVEDRVRLESLGESRPVAGIDLYRNAWTSEAAGGERFLHVRIVGRPGWVTIPPSVRAEVRIRIDSGRRLGLVRMVSVERWPRHGSPSAPPWLSWPRHV